MTLLSQIINKGVLQQEDFCRLVEEYPMLMQKLASIYGLTIAELRLDYHANYFQFSDFENGIEQLLNYQNSLSVQYNVKKIKLIIQNEIK